MTLTIAALVVVSACVHPLWNLLLKGDTDRAASWWSFSVLLAVIGGANCLIGGHDVFSIANMWPWLVMSWFGQMAYGLALIKIYEQGDLSAYYPIVRASPVGVAILGFAFFGKAYEAAVLAGIALSVFGGFWLQKQPGRRILDDPRTLALAVFSMMGTAVYSIADSHAMTEIEPAVLFFWVETGLSIAYLPVMSALGQRNIARRAFNLMAARPLRQLAVGVLGYVSYALILKAYSLGGDVAAVTTVRQLSIPVSIVLGGMVLREGLIARRLGASMLLIAGIMLVVYAA